MYETPLNVFQIDSAFSAYYQTHFFTKNNYTRFYKRWRRSISQQIDEKGFLQEENLSQLIDFQQNTDKNARGAAEGNWTSVGPKETFWLKDDNAAQAACPWQTNIYAFDISQSNTNILYAASETGAFYKTTDKGMNWQAIGDGFLFNGEGEAVAIHPTNPDIVYFGVGSQIVKTSDGGKTFKAVYTQTNLYPIKIAINSANPNIIISACNTGLYRSIDGGTTWTTIATGVQFDVEFHPTNPNIVYALRKNTTTNFSTFVVSNDAGVTWSSVTNGWLSGLTGGEGRIAVTAANPQVVYVLLLTDKEPRLLKSTDTGASFTQTASGSTTDFGMNNGQGFYDLDLCVSPLNENLVIAASTTAYRSADGGKTFISIGGYGGKFPLHPDIQEIKAVGNECWIMTDGGTNFSTDFFGNNQSTRMNGIDGTDFWGYSQGWHEDIMVGGRYHNGNTVMYENYPAGKALRMGGAEAGTGYVMQGRPRHVKYSDLGDGWVVPNKINENSGGRFVFSKTPNEDEYGFNAGEIEIDPRCFGHYYVTQDSTLWKSTDGGISFLAQFKFPKKTKKIEVSRSNPNILYVNTDSEIYRSEDNGKTFAKLTKPATFNCTKMSMSINPLNDKELWISSPNGTANNRIFKTIDGGKIWTNLSTPLVKDYALYNVAHHAGTNGGVYICALPTPSKALTAKVFYRNNSMTEWIDFSNQLPYNYNTLKTVPFYKKGVLRTAGNRGVWETPLYEKPKALVQIQATVDKLSSDCARDTFYFEDYSISTGAQKYTWQFSPTPDFISEKNTRNPKVMFGKSGVYTAKLTLNDTISNEIKITVGNVCGLDTVPGFALKLDGASSFAVQKKPMLLNTNTFTYSAWVKSLGVQKDFAALFMCRGNTDVGLSINGANQELRYDWQEEGYWKSTGFILPQNVWTHVAMVVNPTSTKVYMNGILYQTNVTNTAAAFDAPTYLGRDDNFGSRDFNGNMDEVCFFKRDLSQNEIRELMHLTKDPKNDVSLVAYYQFNEKNGAAFDKINVNHLDFSGNAQRVNSTCAVGKGASQRTTITQSGIYNFDKINLKTFFTKKTNFPNGEICITRINQSPDSKIDKNEIYLYFILRNFGKNTTFDAPDSLIFAKYPKSSKSLPNFYSLYQRGIVEEGNTWKDSKNRCYNLADFSVHFGKNTTLTNATQFCVPRLTLKKPFNFGNENEDENATISRVQKAQLFEDFVLYPNPLSKGNTLQIRTQFDGFYTLKIFNQEGRMILKQLFSGNQQLADLELTAGTYFYEIITAEKRLNGKVVVQ